MIITNEENYTRLFKLNNERALLSHLYLGLCVGIGSAGFCVILAGILSFLYDDSSKVQIIQLFATFIITLLATKVTYQRAESYNQDILPLDIYKVVKEGEI